MRRVVDYQGREIRPTEERLAHMSEHPEMREMGPEVEQTLRKPEFVVRSLSDPEVHLYYRFIEGTCLGDMFLCAVVKAVVNPFLITGYLTDRPKKGERIWPASR
ncbi:MAG: hypothetical protein ACYTFI_03195 [Planctomycetota bacterium]|jgi:hypothetical protein